MKIKFKFPILNVPNKHYAESTAPILVNDDGSVTFDLWFYNADNGYREFVNQFLSPRLISQLEEDMERFNHKPFSYWCG